MEALTHPSASAKVDAVASEAQVRAELERVLAAPEFAKAERLSRLLRFVVEEALAGRGADLKEYPIGVEVFDRPDFDPRMDPIVRVEARRLRTKLDAVYAAGSPGPVRIELPKGGYVPSFDGGAPPGGTPARPRRYWAAVAGAVVLIVAGWAWYGRSKAAAPDAIRIAVIPEAEGEDPAFADQLAESLSVELTRNEGLRVIAWPMVVAFRSRYEASKLMTAKAVSELDAEAVLAIYVHRQGYRRRVAAMVLFADQGVKEWAGEYEPRTEDSFAAQRELTRSIADEVRRAMPRILAHRR